MLTVNEIAKMLKLHPQTVYRWIYAGKIRALTINGTIRIDEAEIERITVTKK